MRYKGRSRYQLKLDHYGTQKGVIASTDLFLTSNELIGSLLKKVRKNSRCPIQTKKRRRDVLDENAARKRNAQVHTSLKANARRKRENS